MNKIIRIATNLMTGQTREIVYTKIDSKSFNISPLYLSSDGEYYTIGILGLFCVDEYIKQIHHEKTI